MRGAPLTVVVFGTGVVPPDRDVLVVGAVAPESGAFVTRGVPSAFVAGDAVARGGAVASTPSTDGAT
jgi:hypothetical protein